MIARSKTSSVRDRRYALWIFSFAAVLVYFTPSLASRVNPETALVFAGLITLFTVWIARLGEAQFDWFHSLALFGAHFFLLFVANGVIILLGISHILTAVYGPAPETVYDLMNRSTLYASSFLLAVYAGFLFWRSATPVRRSVALSPVKRTIEPHTRKSGQLLVAAWLSLACSYAGCVILVVIFGGMRNVIGDPMAIIESRGAFWPFVMVWASLWSFGIFYLNYYSQRKLKHLFGLMLTLPTMVFEFLTGGTKMAIILPVVCALILRHYLVERLTWKFMPKLALFTLSIFVIGYSYRGPGGVGEFGESLSEYAQKKAFIFETFFGRFYGTDSFMVVLDASAEGYPLQHGKTMNDLLYFYVPRALWREKPESYALEFGREFLGATSEGGQTFFTPTLPGELYLNFGIAGLFVGGLLTGILLWEVYRRFVIQQGGNVIRKLTYAVLIPFVALLLSGPISTIIEYILLRCLCFAMFYWFSALVILVKSKHMFSRSGLSPRISQTS